MRRARLLNAPVLILDAKIELLINRITRASYSGAVSSAKAAALSIESARAIMRLIKIPGLQCEDSLRKRFSHITA